MIHLQDDNHNHHVHLSNHANFDLRGVRAGYGDSRHFVSDSFPLLEETHRNGSFEGIEL